MKREILIAVVSGVVVAMATIGVQQYLDGSGALKETVNALESRVDKLEAYNQTVMHKLDLINGTEPDNLLILPVLPEQKGQHQD